MSQKRQVLVNALMSIVQVVINAGALFVLYRFLLDTLGAADFGVWALVLAWTSASSIANLGLAGSTVKFVSQYLARDDKAHVVRIVQTATITVAVFLAVALFAIYPLLTMLLGVIVKPIEKLPAALSILPYTLLSFWLTSVAQVFLSSIDGFQRVDLRSALYAVVALVYVGLAFVLVPEGGLIGLAEAQVIQAGLLLAVAWLVLKRLLPTLPVAPTRWNRAAFAEMLSYSINFQVIAFTQMLLGPVTKSLISRVAGVDVVTFFEMGHKLVFQLRALIVTAHQAIVPTIANLQERDPAMIQEIYRTSYRLLLFLILPSLPLLIGLTPLISRIWIGSYQPLFVVFTILLFVGWFLNMIANPAYFANMGTGHLRWNVRGHLIIGGLNVGLGVLLGWYAGHVGVVIGYVVALIAGSLVIALAYQREQGIRFASLVQRESVLLGLAGLGGLALILILYPSFEATWSLFGLTLATLATYLIVVGVPLWTHSMRRQVQAWLRYLVFGQRPGSPSVKS